MVSNKRYFLHKMQTIPSNHGPCYHKLNHQKSCMNAFPPPTHFSLNHKNGISVTFWERLDNKGNISNDDVMNVKKLYGDEMRETMVKGSKQKIKSMHYWDTIWAGSVLNMINKAGPNYGCVGHPSHIATIIP